MTTIFKRTTLLASSLALGLLATLQLQPAMAQTEHDGHHPQEAATAAMPMQGDLSRMPQQGGMMDHGQMMDHGSMEHAQMMKQMHAEHMNHGQMNHGSMPPAGSKDGKDGK